MNSLSHITAAGRPGGRAGHGGGGGSTSGAGQLEGEERGGARAAGRARSLARATSGAGERKFFRGHRALHKRFRPAEAKQQGLHFRFTPR